MARDDDDDDDDYRDRGRRRRDDYDSRDPPRRGRRYDEDDDDDNSRRLEKKVSGLGLASLIFGLLALTVAWIPCFGMMAWPVTILGGILGFVGWTSAASQKNVSPTFAIVGTAANAVAFLMPFFVLIAIGLGSGASLAPAIAQKNAQAKQVEQAMPIEISADQLLREYKENEPKANDSYKGKVVQVSGPVKRVTEGWVEIKGNGKFEFLTVDCHFDDRQVMAALAAGDQISVKGVCDGKGIGGINIRSCQFVK